MKLEHFKKIELPYVIITFKKVGFVHIHYRGFLMTIEESKMIYKLVRENSPWEKCPFFVSGEEFSSHDKESKVFNASEEVIKHCSAQAFLIKNTAEKLVFNFFIRMYKPQTQSRCFDNENDAAEWLVTFIPNNKYNSTIFSQHGT